MRLRLAVRASDADAVPNASSTLLLADAEIEDLNVTSTPDSVKNVRLHCLPVAEVVVIFCGLNFPLPFQQFVKLFENDISKSEE